MGIPAAVDNILGEFGFRVIWYNASDHFAYMKVYKIVVRNEKNEPEFEVDGNLNEMTDRFTIDADKAEVYLEGHIKWDGCTELDMGCPHWCEPEDYQKHCDLLKYLYHRAMELMGRQDEMEPWPTTMNY